MYIYGKHPNEGNAEASQEEIEKTHTHGRKGSRGEMAMKRLVKVITFIAFMFLIIGGSALDSRNILVPIAMIVPALIWFGLLAWANR